MPRPTASADRPGSSGDLQLHRLGELVAALSGCSHATAGRLVRQTAAAADDSLDVVARALCGLGMRRTPTVAADCP